MIWSYLIHLGTNMWVEPLCDAEGMTANKGWSLHTNGDDHLRCEDHLWEDVTERLAAVGCNQLVIDIGEGLQYKSHPELAVKGSWSHEKMRAELCRLREMGLEPIPKLNFSAGHDLWLGEYARMLSTKVYYKVVKDLIEEVAELFDRPRFFHIGMDEENPGNQRLYNYMCVRQYELWWHDFLYMVDCVEQAGCRPWMWSDYGWKHTDTFFERMPKSILQSNWHYGEFGEEEEQLINVRMYDLLHKNGYDHIPAGSIWNIPDNLTRTVSYCLRQGIGGEHLLGFMQAPWFFTLEDSYDKMLEGVEDLRMAKELWERETQQ